MRLKFIISIFILIFFSYLKSFGFENEKINYVVSYKWGLIQKDAGDIEVSLKNNGHKYDIILCGKTKPWADKFFEVRDTLKGEILREGFKPISYTMISHEKGKYKRDEIKYEYSGSNVIGKVHKLREKKDGSIESKSSTIEGTSPAFDLLSVFFYLRTIDYSSLMHGHVVKSTVFSGDKAEDLTVTFLGLDKIKLKDKSERETYHIKFNFTSGGKKKSSDDIDAWISTDSSHIPLLIVGSLTIGQIRCTYLPN